MFGQHWSNVFYLMLVLVEGTVRTHSPQIQKDLNKLHRPF